MRLHRRSPADTRIYILALHPREVTAHVNTAVREARARTGAITVTLSTITPANWDTGWDVPGPVFIVGELVAGVPAETDEDTALNIAGLFESWRARRVEVVRLWETVR